MSQIGRIRGRAPRAKISFLSVALARYHGRRDASGLLPVLAEAWTEGAPTDRALPPYVLGVRAQALCSGSLLHMRTLRTDRRLHRAIQSESVRIVTQYTERGRPAPAALARYGAMVAAWRDAASAHRALDRQLAERANRLLACYWDSVWLEARRTGDLAEPRPTGWLPGMVRPDFTRPHPGGEPVTGQGIHDWGNDEGPAAAPSAVRQALAILDSQAVRAPGARPTAGRAGRP
ncbi:hypothetical protein [Streptomyces sp. NPDC060198]|uniref:hypothetical protein n=1 Tax=Streptomyces sp. NPDC060198 TaxID=3347070 RepID=UPI00365C7EF0